MRSHGKSSWSAITKVKVLSSENSHNALGQRLHILEARIRTHAKGESVTDVPGSKSMAGKRTVYIGTWENRSVLKRSFQEAEEATRKFDVLVVGLTYSRGVGRVIPAESQGRRTLEEVSSLTQREEARNAIH